MTGHGLNSIVFAQEPPEPQKSSKNVLNVLKAAILGE